jgi:hypothetical protein
MMGALKRHVPLWVAVLCGLALAVGGFWLGRSGPGAPQGPRVVRGTVTAVGQPVNEFALTLDGTDTTVGYALGPVPWTDSTDSDTVNDGSTPPCVAVGRHVTVGVIAVTDLGQTSDQVIWVQCG